jgi:hypothetical protein
MIGFRLKNPANPTISRAVAYGKYREFFMKALFTRALLTKALGLAAAIMLSASPALAQVPKLNLLQDNKPAKTQEERDAESAQEKAYKDSLKKIPDAKAPADPWGTVRSPDAPAKSASSSKSKAKTGTAGTGTN